MIAREIRMLELKKEVKLLLSNLGEDKKYDLKSLVSGKKMKMRCSLLFYCVPDFGMSSVERWDLN